MRGKRERTHQCGFCGVNLTAQNRAKEHVMRRSWLARLDHSKTMIQNTYMSTEGVQETRAMPADQLLAGEVCAQCNNGWMNHLDQQVERWLMRAVKFDDEVIDVTTHEARQIGRWLLKMAIASELTDRPHRRHIPKSIRHHLRRANWLPTGFAVFTCRSDIPMKGVGFSMLDVWPWGASDLVRSVPQSRRMKFAVQYDNLVIGCCYFHGKARPRFTGIAMLHWPLLANAADFDLDRSVEQMQLQFDVWESPVIGNSILNLALATISVQE